MGPASDVFSLGSVLASDVFSLGSVLVYAAAGQSPFGDHPPLVLMMRISGQAPDLDMVPDVLRGPIAACMAKRPEDRPTAAELSGMLGTVAAVGRGWLPPVAAAIDLDPHVPTSRDVRTRVETELPTPPEVAPVSGRALLAAMCAVAVVAAGAIAVADAYGLGTGTKSMPPPRVEVTQPRLK